MRPIDADVLTEIFIDRMEKVKERFGFNSSEAGILSGAYKLLQSQPTIESERKNESVGCSGCKYDWFGDPRCNRCARSFQDYYEADMRGEKHETD